jgi:hypothetical protein
MNALTTCASAAGMEQAEYLAFSRSYPLSQLRRF